MKKKSSAKENLNKKVDKSKDLGELRKPSKLKPLKEKENKNWKVNFENDDEEADFSLEETDLKLDTDLEHDEEDFFEEDF